jgi:hypothetical protein
LCLLNTLTGDPFYVEFNQQAYDTFKPQLTAEVEAALADLKHRIKDVAHSIISAQLCVLYSAVDVESLSGMLSALDHPEAMQRGMQQSPYYDETEWEQFLNIRDHLRTIFHFLEQIGFEEYWQKEILPQIEPEVQKIENYLRDYDVVAQLEAIIGYRLPSPTISVYVLHYTRPHGIKVIGQNFLTAGGWHPKIALRTAIHEMLHPPYDFDADVPLQQAIAALQNDPFVSEKFASHNPDFGYNTFSGYVEENCVRALDQLVAESFDVARNPQERWRDEDDGMHVLAAALYHTLKTQGFSGGFRDFFVDALQTQLAPGKVQSVYDAFMSEAPLSSSSG